MATPDLTTSPRSPLCHSCEAPSTAPSASPSMELSESPSKLPTTAVPTENCATTPNCFQNRAQLKAAIDSCYESSDYASAYGPISTWDVSRVQDMSNLLAGMPSFNEDISSWDTSAVTDFSNMFQGATSFNQPISVWNTSSAKTFSYM